MRPNACVQCQGFPCADVRHDRYCVPDVRVNPAKVSIVMISEAAPPELRDGYYAAGDALFAQTTVQAFAEAGAAVTSIRDILRMGVYLTTAVKCAKIGYAIKTVTVETCSRILSQELALFPQVQTLLLMGDVAIKAINAIARASGEPRVVPASPTYKLRGQVFHFRGLRVFPSYLQAGPSYFIEKSKRRMIAEDIAAALALRTSP